VRIRVALQVPRSELARVLNDVRDERHGCSLCARVQLTECESFHARGQAPPRPVC